MTKQTKPKSRKKTLITIILSVFALFVLPLAAVFLRGLYLGAGTKGERIAAYENPRSALLVIDAQNDTWNNARYSRNKEDVMTKVNTAVEWADNNGVLVIYIKMEISNPLDLLLSQGNYKKGSDGAQLTDRLILPSEYIYSKNRNDTFSNEAFDSFLKERQIDILYLVGADAGGCVYGTAKGGINRGYKVEILKDAVFSLSDKIMGKMLEQYQKDKIGVNTVEILCG